MGLRFLSFPVTVLVFPPVGAGQSSLAAGSPIGACVAQPYWGSFFTDWSRESVSCNDVWMYLLVPYCTRLQRQPETYENQHHFAIVVVFIIIFLIIDVINESDLR